MNTNPYCPECGVKAVRKTQDDGDVFLVCPNDNCPRIVTRVESVADAFTPPDPFSRKV